MKYICLGYIEPGKIEGMTADERHPMLDECFERNDHLRANGHVVAEGPLQPLRASRRKNDQDRGGAGLQRRRPVAGDRGLYAGEGNHLNGGPRCRFFAI
jgi:hypothetical protein